MNTTRKVALFLGHFSLGIRLYKELHCVFVHADDKESSFFQEKRIECSIHCTNTPHGDILTSSTVQKDQFCLATSHCQPDYIVA